jgi:hypothetical protein
MKLNNLHTDKKTEEKGKAFLKLHRTGVGRPPSPKWVTPATAATSPPKKEKPGSPPKA